jgi:hypothetical protein
MGKKNDQNKPADAKVVKEGPEVLTTKDEGVIPNDDEAGKAIDPDKVETQDEKINAIGSDVETLKRPESDPVVPEYEEDVPESEWSRSVRRVEKQNQVLRGAMIYLVKSLMTPADVEDFKKLFPGLM